jgi:5'-nucleotidase
MAAREEPPMLRRLFATAVAALALAVAGARPAVPADGTVTVKVIAINDTHGYLEAGQTYGVPDPADPRKTVRVPVGGMAYLATAVARLRAQNPRNVLVGAGDLVGASPLASGLFHDEPEIEALDRIGLAVAAVGNHEFDAGKDELLRKAHGGCRRDGTPGVDTCLGGRFGGATFQYLAANVIDEATGKTLFPPYAIERFDAGGGRRVAIAFVGIVLKETPSETTAAGVRGVHFLDEATTINALLPVLARAGVHAVVPLVHQGLFTKGGYDDHACPGAGGDLIPILDRLDPSIKLVISAHTHAGYICPDGQGTTHAHVFYSQAASFTRMLTDLDVTLDVASDTIVRVRGDNRLVVNDRTPNPAAAAYPPLPPDPAIAALVARYVTATAPLVNRPVGRLTGDLTRDGETTTAGGSGETTMGDVVADAHRDAGAGTADPAVAGFINAGGVRADLPAGVVTYGAMFSVAPFGDLLVSETLTGAQIYTLLDEQFVGKSRPQILGVSHGFTYTWDASQPDDRKVVRGSVKIDGVPVTETGTYRVTVDEFMAGGGDGFTALTQGTGRRTGDVDHDVLEHYLEAHDPLEPPARNRITRLH